MRPTGRRWLRHGGLGFLSSGILWATLQLSEPASRSLMASLVTGYLGWALVVTTLVMGPVALLRGRSNPANTYLRRDLGIWAGLWSIAHVIVALQVCTVGAV